MNPKEKIELLNKLGNDPDFMRAVRESFDGTGTLVDLEIVEEKEKAHKPVLGIDYTL